MMLMPERPAMRRATMRRAKPKVRPSPKMWMMRPKMRIKYTTMSKEVRRSVLRESVFRRKIDKLREI